VLGELDSLGITFVTLRMRSVALQNHIASLPASAWRTVARDRDGAYFRTKAVDEEATLSSYPRHGASARSHRPRPGSPDGDRHQTTATRAPNA
jgi:hypothetical protein